MNLYKTLIPTIVAAVLMTGCGSANNTSNEMPEQNSTAVQEAMNQELFAKTETDSGNELFEGTSIDLSKETGDKYTITSGGTYTFTGKWSGQIAVNAQPDAKVKIVLYNADISNDKSACIFVSQADKVIISSEEGSTNRLESSGVFPKASDKIDGTVYSKQDLQISGRGNLNVVCEQGHGIVANDDLDIKNVSLSITSAKKGIKVNDTFTMESGKINIDSKTEGIEALVVDIVDGELNIDSMDDGINASDGSGRSADPKVTQPGTSVYIRGGSITISSGGDGIDSNGDLLISGGNINIVSFGDGGNSAIDYAGKCDVTGGTITSPNGDGIDAATQMNDNDKPGGFSDEPGKKPLNEPGRVPPNEPGEIPPDAPRDRNPKI